MYFSLSKVKVLNEMLAGWMPCEVSWWSLMVVGCDCGYVQTCMCSVNLMGGWAILAVLVVADRFVPSRRAVKEKAVALEV